LTDGEDEEPIVFYCLLLPKFFK